MTMQRSKESVMKLKFSFVMDTTRLAGDEVAHIVKTK
jgi:hypothetical protein